MGLVAARGSPGQVGLSSGFGSHAKSGVASGSAVQRLTVVAMVERCMIQLLAAVCRGGDPGRRWCRFGGLPWWPVEHGVLFPVLRMRGSLSVLGPSWFLDAGVAAPDGGAGWRSLAFSAVRVAQKLAEDRCLCSGFAPVRSGCRWVATFPRQGEVVCVGGG
jgi:hypothetical protein